MFASVVASRFPMYFVMSFETTAAVFSRCFFACVENIGTVVCAYNRPAETEGRAPEGLTGYTGLQCCACPVNHTVAPSVSPSLI